MQVVDRFMSACLVHDYTAFTHRGFSFFFMTCICIRIIVEQRVDFCLFLRGILKVYKDINVEKKIKWGY